MDIFGQKQHVRKWNTVNRHVLAKKPWTSGHLSMDFITWTSVNEELFIDKCPWTSVYGQLSIHSCPQTSVYITIRVKGSHQKKKNSKCKLFPKRGGGSTPKFTFLRFLILENFKFQNGHLV